MLEREVDVGERGGCWREGVDVGKRRVDVGERGWTLEREGRMLEREGVDVGES